jgi:isochorismate hydrolase
MRDFEDYCWRDLLTPEMVTIYSAYHRERTVRTQSALVVIHPPRGFLTTDESWCANVRRLSDAMRQLGLAVIHSVRPGEPCDARLDAQLDEVVCSRTTESAFLLADLEAHLTRAAARGVVLCGAPMSGALRATAVEAKSFGYKTAIAEDATGDEATLLRMVALFDVAHKYADVMTTDEVIEILTNNSGAAAA